MRSLKENKFITLLLIPWVAQVVFFWDMPFLSNVPRVLSVLSLIAAIFSLFSNKANHVQLSVFFLSVNIVVFLVIAVVCSLFFPPRRLSLILCGIVLLWVYDVFYLVFAVGRAKKRMKHMNES